jgi:hypothetical protein
MLPGEVVVHAGYLREVVVTGGGKFCEFEVFRAVWGWEYLQKCLRMGKLVAFWKVRPSTT